MTACLVVGVVANEGTGGKGSEPERLHDDDDDDTGGKVVVVVVVVVVAAAVSFIRPQC